MSVNGLILALTVANLLVFDNVYGVDGLVEDGSERLADDHVPMLKHRG